MGFDQHLVAGFGQRLHTGRSYTDARFVVLDLFGNADDHVAAPLPIGRPPGEGVAEGPAPDC